MERIGTIGAVVRTLGKGLELRGLEPIGHTARLAALSYKLALKLKLSPQQSSAIALGAYLHDLGKFWLPEYLADQTGNLENSEWEMMQQHPALGTLLAERVQGLWPQSLELVRHHHERYDGKGYPSSLSGQQIPLAARVFAVVDAYEAMTVEWWHRRARTPTAAAYELLQESGKTFDPAVVTAFLELMQLQPQAQSQTAQPTLRRKRRSNPSETLPLPPEPLFAVVGLRGELHYASPAAATQLGLRPGENMLRRLNDADAVRIRSLYREAIGRGRRPRPLDVRFHDSNAWRWLSLEPHLIELSKRQPPMLFIWGHDRSAERRSAERLLLMNQAVRSSTAAVLITDPSERIVEANPAFLKSTGYDLSEVLGRTPRLLQGPQSSREVLLGVRKALDEQKAVRFEIVNYRKNGEPFWVRMGIDPVFGQNGRLTHFVAVQEEISELKQAQAAIAALLDSTLRAQEAERERIALDLHDGPAQTLVSAMRYVEASRDLLREGEEERGRTGEKNKDQDIAVSPPLPLPPSPTPFVYLEKSAALISDAVKQVRQTISDLIPPDLEVLGLKAALLQVLQRFEREESWEVERNLRTVELPREVQVVFYRIFSEALHNIRKHAQTERVEAKLVPLDAGRVLLEVRDFGVGFEQEPSSSSLALGSGMGLSSMRRRAELAGCSFEVQSQSGQGTVVRVHYQTPAPSLRSGPWTMPVASELPGEPGSLEEYVMKVEPNA